MCCDLCIVFDGVLSNVGGFHVEYVYIYALHNCSIVSYKFSEDLGNSYCIIQLSNSQHCFFVIDWHRSDNSKSSTIDSDNGLNPVQRVAMAHDKITANLQMTYSDAFYSTKRLEYQLEFHGSLSSGSNSEWFNDVSDNGVAPIRRQAIIWTDHGLICWHTYASLGLNEL